MRATLLLTFLLVPSLLWAEFKGDGVYTRDTSKDVVLWFDFHSHELILPSFPLNRKGSYKWEFQGYCSENGRFSLDFITQSKEERSWWQDKTNIEVEVTSQSGKSLIKRSGPLNSYQATYKLKKCKVVTRKECPVLENEWITSYNYISNYGGRPHEASSIVLSNKNKKTAAKKNEHHYYNIVRDTNIGCGKYLVTAKVKTPFWEHDVQGKIRIISGWK